MAWIETITLLKLFGTSESSAATSRRRICLASKDGELRLDSSNEVSPEIIRINGCQRTVSTLSYGDNDRAYLNVEGTRVSGSILSKEDAFISP